MRRIADDVSFDPRHIARRQQNRQARLFDPWGAASDRRLADRPVMRYGAGESPLARRKEPVMSTSTWIILGVIVALVLFVITVYNGLVSLRQRVNQSYADVDVQMKQRHDLIPNLVETVKGYAAHESGTLEAVIKARNSAVAAQGQGPAQQAAAENALTGALRQVFALSEAYPNLKANENFQQLQTELTDLENKIAASRRFFNNAVQEYNTGIQRFPAALFAGALGFSEKQFFDLGADRQAVSEAPQVKF
jgi:LemA protein